LSNKWRIFEAKWNPSSKDEVSKESEDVQATKILQLTKIQDGNKDLQKIEEKMT